MDSQLRLDRTVNINTLIAIATFVVMVIGGVIGATVVYSRLQSQADAWGEFQKRQEQYNAALNTDRSTARVAYDLKLATIVDALAKISSVSDQQTYQIAQLQKKDEENDSRLGRMTESYGNKFTEIQASLAVLTTQQALASQTLNELKSALLTPERKQ